MKVRSDRDAAGLALRLLLLVLLSSIALQANALSSDAQQPIQIEADSLVVRDKDKTSIYSGNVQLNQGSLEIRCDQLTLYFDDNKELILMEMTGTPATFRLLNDLQQELSGQGEHMEYHVTESTLISIGNARCTQAGDTIKSEKIQVDTNTGDIQAGGTDSDSRVRMLIQPKQE